MENKYVWKKLGDDWCLVKKGEEPKEDESNIFVELSRLNNSFPWTIYVKGKERKDIQSELPSDDTNEIKRYIIDNINNILGESLTEAQEITPSAILSINPSIKKINNNTFEVYLSDELPTLLYRIDTDLHQVYKDSRKQDCIKRGVVTNDEDIIAGVNEVSKYTRGQIFDKIDKVVYTKLSNIIQQELTKELQKLNYNKIVPTSDSWGDFPFSFYVFDKKQTNESLDENKENIEIFEEDLEAGDCVYHRDRDEYYYLKKHGDKGFELFKSSDRNGFVPASPRFFDKGSPFYNQLTLKTKKAVPQFVNESLTEAKDKETVSIKVGNISDIANLNTKKQRLTALQKLVKNYIKKQKKEIKDYKIYSANYDTDEIILKDITYNDKTNESLVDNGTHYYEENIDDILSNVNDNVWENED